MRDTSNGHKASGEWINFKLKRTNGEVLETDPEIETLWYPLSLCANAAIFSIEYTQLKLWNNSIFHQTTQIHCYLAQ